MYHLNTFKCFVAAGLSAFGLLACSDSSSSISAPKSEQSSTVVFDTVRTIDEKTGQVIEKIDTLQTVQDTVRQIDEKTGDTVKVVVQVVVPADTSLRWVGNSALVITEISPLNMDFLDEDGQDPAWIEIYNAGNVSANLKGYTLRKSLDEDAKKFKFDDELIAAKSFRIVFCDKKDYASTNEGVDSDSVHFRTHTSWKLNKEGGTVYLVDMHNGIRDSVEYPEVQPGVSWGIVDGGGWQFFEKPTPEAPNTESKASSELDPDVNMDGLKAGFYNDAITIKAPEVDEGVKVRCTKNGSEPTKDSEVFSSSMSISENTVLRCAGFKDGAITKKVTTKTFFVGETVNMPVVAISVDSVFFKEHYVPKDKCGSSDPKSCPEGLMEDVEFPVHVEYFSKGSKNGSNGPDWEVDAGISLMGGWSRVNDKKSVAVVMREEYQDGRINFPLFETRKETNSKFKGFNLRNNGNRFVSDYMEDAVGGAVLEGSGVDYQRSRQVVVFYNGRYWGIHDMRERFNRHYVETNYGIDANEVTMIKHLGGFDAISVSSGDSSLYVDLLNFVGDNDFGGADETSKANYEMVKTMMDVGNFADYMAAEIFYKNGDWPNNNVRAWRTIDRPWKFMVYDLDHGFGWKWGVNNGEFDASSTKMFDWIKKGGGNKPCKDKGCFANLYIKLIKNPDFERLFLNHSAVMFNSYVNGKNVGKAVSTIAATLDESEMERDIKKFPRNDYPDGFSKSGSSLTSWAEERDASVLQDYADEFDLSGNMIKVTLAADGGEVLVDDMHLPGQNGGSTNFSGKFFDGVDMMLTAVAATGKTFTGWSDGVKDNPRLVSPKDGDSFKAVFK